MLKKTQAGIGRAIAVLALAGALEAGVSLDCKAAAVVEVHAPARTPIPAQVAAGMQSPLNGPALLSPSRMAAGASQPALRLDPSAPISNLQERITAPGVGPSGLEQRSSVLPKDPEAGRSLANAMAPCQRTLTESGDFDEETFESGIQSLFDGALARNAARTVEQRVFAVHATPFIPADGVLRAGASDISAGKQSIKSEPPSFRPTIHFSLGELVRGHGGFSWENHAYAVVVPLGAIKSQLVNLNAYDTYVLGDIRLPEDAVLVMPKSEAHRAPPGVQVETYDPGKGALRSAIDRAIEKRGGWHIRMEEKSPSLDSVGTVRGRNVNTAAFFDPFLKENPRVSFGSHIGSQVGIAFRFGNIEQAINRLMKGYSMFGSQTGTDEMVFLKNFAKHHLSRLERELESARLPEGSMQSFREKREKALSWLNIVEADLELQRRRGVTLQRADERLLEEAKALRSDPAALGRYLENHAGDFARAGGAGKLDPAIVSEYLAGSPLSEMQELASILVAGRSMDAAGMETLSALYGLRRTMILDLSKARKEGVLDLMRDSLSRLASNGASADLFEKVMRLLGSYLDERSSRLPSALRILHLPEIKSGLEARYGFKLPAPEQFTLQGFLNVHPETRGAFEEKRAPAPSTALTIVKGLERIKPEKSATAHRSFAEAKYAAWDADWRGKRLAENLDAVTRPMRMTRDLDSLPVGEVITFYEQLRRGDYGTLDEAWSRLGLQKEFRRMFPGDADFWGSDKSMARIYELLGQR